MSFFGVCELSFFYLRKIFDVYLPITLILWIYQQILNQGNKKSKNLDLENFRSDEIKDNGYMNNHFSRTNPKTSAKGSFQRSRKGSKVVKQNLT